jgi:predicted transcriptional regulator
MVVVVRRRRRRIYSYSRIMVEEETVKRNMQQIIRDI